MATIKIGNLFHNVSPKADIFITTNRVIKKDGTLTMGAGIALEAKQRYPQLPAYFAHYINTHYKDKDCYHIIPPMQVDPPPDRHVSSEWSIGAIQTKVNWKDPSPSDLILCSLRHLDTWAVQQALTKEKRRLHCPIPGIGKGGLDFWIVLDMIHTACNNDNITFWISEEYVKGQTRR